MRFDVYNSLKTMGDIREKPIIIFFPISEHMNGSSDGSTSPAHIANIHMQMYLHIVYNVLVYVCTI